MAIQNAALDLAVTGIKDGVVRLSLHSTDGSTDGSGELTGGNYTRQEPTYGTASNGAVTLTGNAVFGGPASSTTVTHLGFWGGTGEGTVWLGSVALLNSRTLVTADTLTITAANISVTAGA